MTNLKIGDKVNVTISMARYGKEDMVFVSEVMDIANTGVWVDHPELRGEDMLFVQIDDNLNNKVEAIQDEIEVLTYQDMKTIKKDLLKAIKYLDDISIAVKVYDCSENDEQTYDVEINYYVDGQYEDGFYNQTFYGRFLDDAEALKMATTRAKAVLRTVKGWFKYDDEITVIDGVEVYHM